MNDEARLRALLRKFANHRDDCRCFICRNLTLEDRELLRELRA